MSTLRDLREMPSRPGSKPPSNGMDSVSRGYVFVKSDSDGLVPTPHCIHHGAMACVGKGIWRGIVCGCGAWWEPTTPREASVHENPRGATPLTRCQD